MHVMCAVVCDLGALIVVNQFAVELLISNFMMTWEP